MKYRSKNYILLPYNKMNYIIKINYIILTAFCSSHKFELFQFLKNEKMDVCLIGAKYLNKVFQIKGISHLSHQGHLAYKT